MREEMRALRALIREAVRSEMKAPTIFGPVNAPAFSGGFDNQKESTTNKELDPSIIWLKGIDRDTGDPYRGKKVYARQGKTLQWEWKPNKVRTLTQDEYLEAQAAKVRTFDPDDPALSREKIARMTMGPDGRWQIFGQWVPFDSSAHAPRLSSPPRGEISPIKVPSAQERRAAKNAPSGPSSVSVVRRRRDEETGEITSITPVRGRR
jgi:hypothetical protein